MFFMIKPVYKDLSKGSSSVYVDIYCMFSTVKPVHKDH